MAYLAKTLIIIGVILCVVGGVMLFSGRHFDMGRLPGDIFIRKGNFSFTFPLTTSVVLSIILSVILILCSRK